MLHSLLSVAPSLGPIKQICAHLCALHAYADNINHQVLAHHYCSHLSEEMHQCVIYDSPDKNARLIGIEYLISKRLFETLEEEEKTLWHTHQYEVKVTIQTLSLSRNLYLLYTKSEFVIFSVKSGMLTSPEMPEAAENQFLKTIANMYGKTVHTWRIDRDALPVGPPSLMVALTNNNQPMNHQLMKEVDRLAGNSMEERRERRKDFELEPKASGADAFERGEKITFVVSRKKE